MSRKRKLSPDTDPLALLRSLDAERRAEALERLCGDEREAIDRAWEGWAHDGQLAPPGDWATWVIKAGRGFGKTLAGAQWLVSLIMAHADREESLSIALVGATLVYSDMSGFSALNLAFALLVAWFMWAAAGAALRSLEGGTR